MNEWGTLAPGQIIDAEEQKKRQQLANKTKERERPVWATGVAQARGLMEAHAAMREEADNPFARADIDPRAEAAQRDAVRFGDPMAGTREPFPSTPRPLAFSSLASHDIYQSRPHPFKLVRLSSRRTNTPNV